MIHNLTLLTISYLAAAAVLVLELLIARRLDRRRTHARRLTRQM